MRIFKYPVPNVCMGERAAVSLQEGAQILHVAIQDGRFTLWAKANPDARMQKRYFTIYPTGLMDIPEGARYLATLHDDQGFVWHVHELPELPR